MNRRQTTESKHMTIDSEEKLQERGHIINDGFEYEPSAKYPNLYRVHCLAGCGWRSAGYAKLWIAETWAVSHRRELGGCE